MLDDLKKMQSSIVNVAYQPLLCGIVKILKQCMRRVMIAWTNVHGGKAGI